jgi:hypothetical protein
VDGSLLLKIVTAFAAAQRGLSLDHGSKPYGINQPEHEKDLSTRVLAWYDMHLKF